ncbi:hypothetical protein EXIGLDRAFT_444652, partial [Exidia glandulosa HHB12029]
MTSPCSTTSPTLSAPCTTSRLCTASSPCPSPYQYLPRRVSPRPRTCVSARTALASRWSRPSRKSSSTRRVALFTKTLGGFRVTVQAGEFTDSDFIVMIDENGTGKTTFVRLLAGDTPDVEVDKQSWAFSLKPQTISPKFPGTVRMLLLQQIKADPHFNMKHMAIESVIHQDVETLCGGELQHVAIVLCLGTPNVLLYLIDEPSSFLDSEQRIMASKFIKRFILHAKKTAFIVEHDL